LRAGSQLGPAAGRRERIRVNKARENCRVTASRSGTISRPFHGHSAILRLGHMVGIFLVLFVVIVSVLILPQAPDGRCVGGEEGRRPHHVHIQTG
jgi:hypothetical protein